LLREGNAYGLALLDVLQLDLGNSKEHTGDKMPHGAAQVDLLRNGNDAHAKLTPSRERIDTLPHRTGDTIQLPHHDHFDRACKDRLLQAYQAAARERGTCFRILEPLHCIKGVTVGTQPALNLGVLAIAFLVGGRYPDVDAYHGHLE
jgi:hypothetical protein